jgi:hypothetical protein
MVKVEFWDKKIRNISHRHQGMTVLSCFYNANKYILHRWCWYEYHPKK